MDNNNSENIDVKSNYTEKSVWLIKEFRWLFLGALFSTFAGKVYEIFLPLLIYRLTHSPEIMGWMRAVEFLPYVLLAMIMGVWIDRVDRKIWCQWMLGGQLICLTISWLAVKYASQPLWFLFPCAFSMMALNFGYLNARMGLVREAVPLSQQGTASAAFSSLVSIFQAMGPALSGFLLLFSDFSIIYLVIASLIFLSWYALNEFSMNATDVKKVTRLADDIKTGLKILYVNSKLLKMSFSVSIFNMCMLMFVIQSLYFTQAVLSFSSARLGIMVSLSGIGGVLGSLVVGFIRKKVGLGCAFISGMVFQIFSYLILLVDKSGLIFYMAFFLSGFFETIVGVSVYTWRQESTQKEHLGKVMGITGTIFKVASPFGLVASGYIMGYVGINGLLWLCCGLHLILSFYLIINKDIKQAR